MVVSVTVRPQLARFCAPQLVHMSSRGPAPKTSEDEKVLVAHEDPSEEPEEPEDLDRRFKSNIRGARKARTVAEIEHENCGVNDKTRSRRHICYTENGECVIMIQSFDGYREVDGLTSQGSMYRPRILANAASESVSESSD